MVQGSLGSKILQRMNTVLLRVRGVSIFLCMSACSIREIGRNGEYIAD